MLVKVGRFFHFATRVALDYDEDGTFGLFTEHGVAISWICCGQMMRQEA